MKIEKRYQNLKDFLIHFVSRNIKKPIYVKKNITYMLISKSRTKIFKPK